MLGPTHIVSAARLVLVAGSLAVAVLTLGPFQGAEKIFGLTDKSAHAIAFGGLLAIAFLGFPRSRRSDLAIAALVLGAAIEVAQLFGHRSASISDWLADAAGVFAVYGASMIEQVRKAAREHGHLTFAQLAALDRRRRRRQRATFEPARGASAAVSFAERASRRFPAR
ncbi:VanZ family protein [Caulobacter segnis]|uniref:Antibiotic resistance protein VanZ n=1 Tax=Caulobacter segnis TaxID=88688 RepID=A0A2W5XFP2_9CAUL|nr:VanZ family protein [Caulobacter segnis]PZR36541.1 MAG: antibiotic resistance protein VanZ [Caulobacter segnis]